MVPVLSDSGFRDFQTEACSLACGGASSRRNCTNRRFKDDELFFLRSGAAEVIKDGVHIASVSALGSVFGEQAALLDQPHTGDVRTLEQFEFYVANAQAMLARDPTVALCVAAILARRLDAGNRSLIEVKHQIQSGEPPGAIGRAVEKVETQLNHSVRDPTGW